MKLKLAIASLASITGLIASAAPAQADGVVSTPNITVTKTCQGTSWTVRLDFKIDAGQVYSFRILDRNQNGPIASNYKAASASFTFTKTGSYQPQTLIATRNNSTEKLTTGVSYADVCGAAPAAKR